MEAFKRNERNLGAGFDENSHAVRVAGLKPITAQLRKSAAGAKVIPS